MSGNMLNFDLWKIQTLLRHTLMTYDATDLSDFHLDSPMESDFLLEFHLRWSSVTDAFHHDCHSTEQYTESLD